jgi:hypothetical protein
MVVPSVLEGFVLRECVHPLAWRKTVKRGVS